MFRRRCAFFVITIAAMTNIALAAGDSTGLVPLAQLKAEQKYKGQDGGLYGEGKNTPPEGHAKLAAEASNKIAPLDRDGKPAKDGKIVLLSIGMSNTTQEFSQFIQLAARDKTKSPSLVIVDAAQGGRDAADWADEQSPIGRQTWDAAQRRLEQSGVTASQVQVVWLKQALKGPGRIGDFPKHSDALQRDIEKIVILAKSRFPNLRIAYLSSRIYAGYAGSQLNPEPYAYEGAFAVRGAILNQIKGDARLNADPTKVDVKSPVLLWGPYLWADGTKGRELDDLVWKPEDFARDGTHPSPTGRQKVAQLLLTFFKADPTAKPWFTAPSAP